MTDTLPREILVDRARLAEHAERFDDMVKDMTLITRLGDGLNNEERNLLSVAYKNVVGERRSSWRVLSAVEQKTEDSARKKTLTADYRLKVEEELIGLCGDLLDILDRDLLPKAEDDASVKVFYLKMKGDYNRYLAEMLSADNDEHASPKGKGHGCTRSSAASGSEQAYSDALEAATSKLQATDPIRLGLVLNYSVFHYEILANREKACAMAQEAFDQAIAVLDDTAEVTYRDTTAILQLLRDNLTSWSQEDGDDANQ